MRIQEAIIVEGIYDKIKLDRIVDAIIVPTYGFSLFTDAARLSYIRTLAEKTGIIILTDADSAGQKIRKFLQENIQSGTVLHAYIPGVSGKEKRKKKPAAAGFLGVEGVSDSLILEALSRVTSQKEAHAAPQITMQDFFLQGLSGQANSKEKRKALAEAAGLPPLLSKKALLSAVNAVLTADEFDALCKTL